MPRPAVLLLWCLLLIAGGCAKVAERGELTGRVVRHNEPISQAKVYFEDAEQGCGAVVALNAEGEFTLRDAAGPGLPPGRYRVAIKPLSGLPPVAANGMPPPEAIAGAASAANATNDAGSIPRKFHNFETSGFVVTIQAGKNPQLVLDLSE